MSFFALFAGAPTRFEEKERTYLRSSRLKKVLIAMIEALRT